jgi:hypothetical protein
MTQFSDTLRQGDAYYAGAAQSDGGERGVPVPKLTVIQFGAIATLDADGVCVAATATTAKTLSATGALVTGGVGVFATPRNVTITSTTNESGVTFTVTGEDQYGETVRETITGPNNTTVSGKKAFSQVTSVACGGAITGNVNVGSGDVIGLPYHLGDKGDIIALTVDGAVETTAPTLVAGFSTSGTSTATTADVRGTIDTNTAPNGSRLFTVVMLVDPTTKESLYGAAQF